MASTINDQTRALAWGLFPYETSVLCLGARTIKVVGSYTDYRRYFRRLTPCVKKVNVVETDLFSCNTANPFADAFGFRQALVTGSRWNVTDP